jgi:curved DNA-binding protein CbpA
VNVMDLPVRGSRTLYDVLGVRSDADTESIERAFREATKAYHPDLHGGDQAAVSRFQDIVAAVAVLRDPDRRAAYDLRLRRRRRGKWLDAAILCAMAGAVFSGGLVIGRLVLFATPPRIASVGQPSVAAPAAQPGEAQVRMEPDKAQIRTQPDTSVTASGPAVASRDKPSVAAPAAQPGEAQVRMESDKAQIRTQPDTESSAVSEPGTSVTASGPAVASRDRVQSKSAGETVPAPDESAEHSRPHLDASEIASLMKRGTESVANGNIGAARMMFKLAAEAGDAAAAFAFAETYDSSVLDKLGAKGITPDDALAQQWYEKARALGSTATPGLDRTFALVPAPVRDPAMQQPRERSDR